MRFTRGRNTRLRETHRLTLPKEAPPEYAHGLSGVGEEAIKEGLSNLSPDAIIAEKCRQNYFTFLTEMWDTIVQDPPHWNWHIPYLCGELVKVLENVAARKPKLYDLVINVPPGTTKSLTCSVFLPAYAWVRGWWWMKFIKTCYAGDLSLELAEKTRDVVQSEKFQRYFPEIKIRRDNTAKTHFKVVYHDKEAGLWRLGGGLFSTSIGSKVTGFHAHVLLTDDPIDPHSSASPTVLESTSNYLSQNLSSRVVDKRNTPHILVQQRVHPRDPSGEAEDKIKKGKRTKIIRLSGDVFTKRKRERISPQSLLEYYDAQGGLLDPIRLDPVALAEMELNLGQFGFGAQVDQDPKVAGAGMFKPERIEIIDPIGYNKAANIVETVRYWDNAATPDGGCFTAGPRLSLLSNGKYLIEDLVHGQWDSERREAIKREVTRLDGPYVKLLQEEEGGSSGKDQSMLTRRNVEDLGNDIVFDRPTGDKVFRADPLSVAVNRSLICMFRAPWNEDLKDEMRDFPGGRYKDIIDALAGAYNYFLKRLRAGTW